MIAPKLKTKKKIVAINLCLHDRDGRAEIGRLWRATLDTIQNCGDTLKPVVEETDQAVFDTVTSGNCLRNDDDACPCLEPDHIVPRLRDSSNEI